MQEPGTASAWCPANQGKILFEKLGEKHRREKKIAIVGLTIQPGSVRVMYGLEGYKVDKYFVMKLIEAAGASGFKGRKRLQKIVFFLKQDKLPLECDYSLHRYGPYSHDLSQICADLTAGGLLAESVESNGSGRMEYLYKLLPAGVAAISATEASAVYFKGQFDRVAPTAGDLLRINAWTLELGSTILFYQSIHSDWDKSFADACEFKSVSVDDPASIIALDFAMKFIEPEVSHGRQDISRSSL